MKLDLQLRDLKSGDRSPKPFASADDAKAWLKDRPKGMEVLGIASHNVAPEVSDELKACSRPLDAEEQLMVEQLRQNEEAAMRKQAEARMVKERAAADKQADEMKNADPKRPMEVRYVFNAGLGPANALDTREISEDVRDAVRGWIAERNSWVEGRNQVVGDARIHVHPGDVPEGAERIISGTFIPVTAPEKKD